MKFCSHLLDLAPGWSVDGDGEAITPAAIEAAERIADFASACGLDVTVFPNLDGGCSVAAYRGRDKVEIEITPTGHLGAITKERGIGFACEVIT